MCSAIGVDPLAGSNRQSAGSSVWAQLLGRSVNDFYFELAVRVVEVCGETRGENGGLIEVRKVRERIMRSRMEGAPEITE
jgi:ESCRT-II complex subunit VPS22